MWPGEGDHQVLVGRPAGNLETAALGSCSSLEKAQQLVALLPQPFRADQIQIAQRTRLE